MLTSGGLAAPGIQGFFAKKKQPPPYDHHRAPQDHRRALGIGLLQGPRRRKFLMSEVLLYFLSGRVPIGTEAPVPISLPTPGLPPPVSPTGELWCLCLNRPFHDSGHV